ncbi:MAG: YdcF family protein [Gammaproteobacteria bacterium]
MEILITRSLAGMLLLPGIFILLMAGSLLLLFRAARATTQASYFNQQALTTAADKMSARSRILRRIAITCFALVLLGLYVFSIPATARALMGLVETYPALTAQDIKTSSAQAIVILGAGRYTAPEYDGFALSPLALERLRYGAYLHRQTGLPLVLSGGDPFHEGISEAALMQQALLDDFKIRQAMTEDKSTTTAENAFFTKKLLAAQGINRVYLVTHAAHMPRAVRMFKQAGIKVTPAPLHFLSLPSGDNRGLLGWMPSARYFERSNAALHELLGGVWYSLRY